MIFKDVVEVVKDSTPLITKDTVVFGLLMISLAAVFYTSSQKKGFWSVFYKFIPALLMCYLIPSILSSTGLISPDWITLSEDGTVTETSSSLYFMASRYLLPAALVLMTLSIDLKAVFNLGPKALIMFLTGSVGIILGGPIAILVIGTISPETVGGEGYGAVWRGLSTIAGSWIGGGANQTAMLEVYQFDQSKYGGMVLVDIVVANLWMALLLLGIGSSAKFDKWLGADSSSIEKLKNKVSEYSESVKREATLTDIMVMLGIGFGAVGIAHFGADFISSSLESNQAIANNIYLSFLTSAFFWLISIATLIGIICSYTPLKKSNIVGHPWPLGRVSAITGCTTMFSARAMREGASKVAAGTPKKGTNAASRGPKSMSGRLKNPRPSFLMARNNGLTESLRGKISALPKRRRPFFIKASMMALLCVW